MISYKNVTREAFVPFKSVNLVNLVTLRHYVKPKVFGHLFQIFSKFTSTHLQKSWVS